jgi:hypothetical protein
VYDAYKGEHMETMTIGKLAELAGRKHIEFAPMTVAAYIASAYWFTSSTSFANPAVSFARMFTNTFCGIAPSGLTMFIVAQFVGTILGFFFLRKLPTLVDLQLRNE